LNKSPTMQLRLAGRDKSRPYIFSPYFVWLVIATLLIYAAPNSVTPSLATNSALSPQLSALAYDQFASSAIASVWQAADGQVGKGASHSWIWGPGAFLTTYEPAATASGNHLVQYFDKGRLEVNDPNADPNSPWYVTSGLLVKEMVSGQLQTADGLEQRTPATAPVAGEAGPTYADFAALTTPRSEQANAPISEQITTAGKVQQLLRPPDESVTTSYFDASAHHNIASPFWQLAQSNAPLFAPNWLYVLGHPITEPYWIDPIINGQRSYVLVQLFERRALTYNPANAVPFQVEFANVGRAYYQWRYSSPLAHEEKAPADYTSYAAIATIHANRSVSVNEQVTYTNSTNQPLSNIVMRVVSRHYPAVLTMGDVTAPGGAMKTRWRDEVNLELEPTTPIPTSEHISFTLNFTLNPPHDGGRFGYNAASDVLTLGDWLPSVVPYENGGWLQYPYASAGDLGVNATANYHVTYTSASPIVVAATGSPQQIGATQWRYDALSVRDVAATISPRLVNPLTNANLRRRVGNVTIYGFFLPEHMVGGIPELDDSAAAFAGYSAIVGIYPYASYVLTEMAATSSGCGNYSQEYPMMALLNPGLLTHLPTAHTWDEWEPQHEVAHAWFYGAVGNDQMRDPWLDEALATSLNLEYVRGLGSSDYAAAAKVMTAALRPYPVSASVFAFPLAGDCLLDTAYFLAVYSQGTTMLNEIRAAMGDSAYRQALRDYYTAFTFKRARPADLLHAFASHTSVNLQPIFDKYLAVY
jgi:hypothetical protein